MKWLTFLLLALTLNAVESIDPSRYEKEVLVTACSDPMQMDIAADGRVFFVERAGGVKVWEPQSRRTVTLASFPSLVTGDAGSLGLTLAPDFSSTGHLYLFRIPLEPPARILISRFTVAGDKIDAATEKCLLNIPLGKGPVQSHCGGGLTWDNEGNLFIGIGDNMPPQDVPAVHPSDPSRDARGTAGNSMELRGKILRITPKPDGSYSIPGKEAILGRDRPIVRNFFKDPKAGRPEVFAFGVRNPFRIAYDNLTGHVAWGDVGGNVKTSLSLGPEGYDEINVTLFGGFFGWPFCSGPNAPWKSFEPKSQRPAGEFFDPQHLINDSPVNTGLKQLPPAIPAVFYYSSAPSREWPLAGSGGRSVTGGVFYWHQWPPERAGDLRLPDELKGTYIFGEWMRNWLAVARLKEDGSFASVEPFPTHLRFRKPSDFQIGPDGALYIAECGDLWTGNSDSQITRVIYRRGNRPPVPVLDGGPFAGRTPLHVKFNAERSSDPDSSPALRFAWDFGGGKKAEGTAVEFTFKEPGVWPVTLTITDSQGLSATSVQNVMAGNEPPRVVFTAPADGGFFEWGQLVTWKLEASDAEDGLLAAEKVLVQMETRNRAASDDAVAPPGLALMRRTTCFACHSATEKSAGPPYSTIAARYAPEAGARDRLAAKIISGGTGVWGELPMPPHPQHTAADASQMVDWILSLAQRRVTTLAPGSSGSIDVSEPKKEWGRAENSIISLTASATDKGGGAVPAQRGEANVVLRSRRQRAAFFDAGHRATMQDNLEQGGLVARISAGGWIAFERIRLSEVGSLRLHGWPQGSGHLKIMVHAGDMNGPVLAEQIVAPGYSTGKRQEHVLPFKKPLENGPPTPVVIRMESPADGVLDIMWVDFAAAGG